jgi:hypothetical protein
MQSEDTESNLDEAGTHVDEERGPPEVVGINVEQTFIASVEGE